MNRRELLRALAALAPAALISKNALMAQVQEAKAAGQVFPLTTVNHLSLNVAHYAKSRDFYVDLLGMRVRWDDGKRCNVEFGSMTSPNGLYIGALAKPGDPPTVGHVAFGIPDFWARKSAIKAELERRGVKIGPDGEGGWTFDEPSHFMSPGMQVTPESDPSMFPGSDRPCAAAESDKCRTAWEAGVAMAGAVPKSAGKGFKATAFSHIVFDVPDVARERDFCTDPWGMKVVSEKPGQECLLRFGVNTLEIRKTSAKARCNSYGFVIENFDKAKVESELKRRGLDPQPDPRWVFAVKDPGGLVIGITDKA